MNGSRVVLLLVLVIAAGLRVVAASGELWLDEIWALTTFEAFDGGWFFDGQASLYTLWGLSVPPLAPELVYRLPALLASGWFLLALWSWSVGRGVGGVIVATLLGLSYPLVLYGSEARGHAAVPLAALTLLSNGLGRSSSTKTTGQTVPGTTGGDGRTTDRRVWLASAFGVLMHPVFAFFVGGCALTALLFAWAGRGVPPGCPPAAPGGDAHRAPWLVPWARRWMPPIAVSTVLIALLRWLAVSGGGPERGLADVLFEGTSMTWGGPMPSAASSWAHPLAVVVTLAAFGLSIAAAVDAWRRQLDELLAFYTATAITFVATFGAFWVTGQYPAMRYLLAGLVAWYAATGLWLGTLVASRRRPQLALVGAVLALFLAGSTWHDALLMRHGRGKYREALRFIADQVPDRAVLIHSDHPFRNGMVARHHLERLGITHLELAAANDGRRADFLIRHDFEPYRPTVEPELYTARGDRFELQRTFRSGPLSGWNWFVYRRTMP